MTKIYTGQGDRGKSSILGGIQYSKNSIIFDSIGGLDELNAVLGVVSSYSNDSNTTQKLLRIQNEIFKFSTEIASINSKPIPETEKLISQNDINNLENEIDLWQEKLPELKKFIIPGGSKLAAFTNLARTVCRRCERAIVGLNEEYPIRLELMRYINRLSDWLFMLFRVVKK
jgi:cob(I)alamin adenosyltransferase